MRRFCFGPVDLHRGSRRSASVSREGGQIRRDKHLRRRDPLDHLSGRVHDSWRCLGRCVLNSGLQRLLRWRGRHRRWRSSLLRRRRDPHPCLHLLMTSDRQVAVHDPHRRIRLAQRRLGSVGVDQLRRARWRLSLVLLRCERGRILLLNVVYRRWRLRVLVVDGARSGVRRGGRDGWRSSGVLALLRWVQRLLRVHVLLVSLSGRSSLLRLRDGVRWWRSVSVHRGLLSWLRARVNHPPPRSGHARSTLSNRTSPRWRSSVVRPWRRSAARDHVVADGSAGRPQGGHHVLLLGLTLLGQMPGWRASWSNHHGLTRRLVVALMRCAIPLVVNWRRSRLAGGWRTSDVRGRVVRRLGRQTGRMGRRSKVGLLHLDRRRESHSPLDEDWVGVWEGPAAGSLTWGTDCV